VALVESVRVEADDPQYLSVLDRRFNKRFSARPDYVCVAHSSDEVVDAVQTAVSDGRRLVVTSGGHCLEGFVSDPEVRVIIDVSPMKRVYYDDRMRAIAVEAGATVGAGVVIGAGSRVDAGAYVERAVLWPSTHVAAGERVVDQIAAPGVRLDC